MIAGKHIEGLVAATHTPFRQDGSLHLDVIERLAAHLLKNGISHAFIGGTTGEGHSLSVDERLSLTQRWCEVARGTALKVIVHVGANVLADARVLAAHAERSGAAAIAAMSPSYYIPHSLEMLIACTADVALAAPNTPFYYYDIPAMTGSAFSMVEFLEVAHSRIPTLTGLKFSNPDLMVYLQCLNLDDSAWDVLWGIDEWLLGALATGARGAVGSSYNFAAPLYHGLMDAFKRGDLNAAQEAQLQSNKLIGLLARYGYLGAAKVVMGMLGVDVGPTRLPNGSPTAEQAMSLRRDLEALGFFEWCSTS
jgi:N-acetylneuraminate lyase